MSMTVGSARHLGLVVLDACRNNPLATSSARAAKGLAAVEPAGGKLLVAYATKHGQIADDGTGPDSPYTSAILEALKVPGLEVGLFWRTVHDSVMTATRGAQEPFTYGALRATAIYIHPGPAPTPAAANDRELALWQSAERLGTADAYRAYLAQYPHGQFSSMAQLQLTAVTRQAAGSANSSSPATTAAASANNCRLPSGDAQRACERAMQGFADAQINLGVMYAGGRGVPQSDTEAVKWYRKAAEQGDAYGQASLGFMYSNGRGVPQSDAEALKWYRLATDQGNAFGQASLGWMYHYGRGVPQSNTEAVKWYRLAAAQGEAQGQSNLGVMYENGIGVPKDRTEAVKWYRLAAKQGDQQAQTALQRLGESSP
jgi:TPR repeat protein